MNRLILGVVLFAILLISPLTWAGYLGKTNNYNCDLDDMRTFDYGYGWEFHSGYIAEQIAVAKGAGRVLKAGDAMKGLETGHMAKNAGKEALEIISKETEVAIIRLKGLGATDEMIETMLKKGATPKDVYNAIKRTDDIDVVWLDEQKSWGHVVENEHNIQIQNALGLPNMENAVKDKILDAAKNGEKSIDDPYLIINNYQNPITSNWYELRVVLWETSNSAIKTAYPRRI